VVGATPEDKDGSGDAKENLDTGKKEKSAAAAKEDGTIAAVVAKEISIIMEKPRL
jgi:hypothetical protein